MIRFPENEQQLKGSRQMPRPFLPQGSPGIPFPFLLPHAAGGTWISISGLSVMNAELEVNMPPPLTLR